MYNLDGVARRRLEISAFGSVDINDVRVKYMVCVHIGGGVHCCCSTLVLMRRSVVSKWGDGE